MKTNMTESDKKLLSFMFMFVIIVAIGYWGVYPQIKRYKKLESKIENEEEKRTLNEMKITNLIMVESMADEYEADIAKEKDEFYQIMNSSEIDRMMTEMATSSGLDIYELNFTMPNTPTERMAYQYSELYQRQLEMKAEYESSAQLPSEEDDLKDLTGDEDDSNKKSKDSDSEDDGEKVDAMSAMTDVFGAEVGGYQPNTDIYAVPVTMTVGGDLEYLEAFKEKLISLDKRVLLVGYSWGEFRDVIRRDSNGNIIGDSGAVNSTIDTSSGDSEASDSSESGTVDGEESTGASDVKIEIITRKSLNIRLEIYMCDTSDINDDASESEDGTVEEGTASEDNTEDGVSE